MIGSDWKRSLDLVNRMDAHQLLACLWNRVGRSFHTRPLAPVTVAEATSRGTHPSQTLEVPMDACATFQQLNLEGWIGHVWQQRNDGIADDLNTDIESCYNHQRFRNGARVLARTARLEDSESAFAELVRDLTAWLEGRVEHPKVAMEPLNIALRLREWMWVLLFAGSHPSFPGSLQAAMWHSMRQQASRLARHIEYDIPGNHPILELAAVWLVHALDSRTRSKGLARWWATQLERESERSFLNDGFHCELSTHYHTQLLRVLVEYVWLAAAAGYEVSPSYWAKIRRWWHVLRHFVVARERLTLLGDGCYPFFETSLAADLATLEALLQQPAADTVPQPETESSYWLKALGGQAGLPCIEPGREPVDQVRYFPRAGYLVARRGNCCDEDLMIFDAGPLGHRPNTGHGHADWLSVVLSLGGVPLLIDPGTHCYADDCESLWFKRAVAHNTLFVRGLEAADLWRFFRWCRLPPRPSLDYTARNGVISATATFEGYQKICGLHHLRRLTLDWRNGLEIEDVIRSQGGVPGVGISYHIGPRWKLDRDGASGVIATCEDRRVWITVRSGTGDLDLAIEAEPVAPAYAAMVTCPVVRCSFRHLVVQERITSIFRWS